MKNATSSQAGTAKTVLEVISVTIGSASPGTQFDSSASNFLQDVGFVGLREIRKKIYGRAPGGDVLFVLECEQQGSSRKFKIIRIRDSVRVELDSGHVIYTSEPVGGSKMISFAGAGYKMKDWEVSCQEASDDTKHLLASAQEGEGLLLFGSDAGIEQEKFEEPTQIEPPRVPHTVPRPPTAPRSQRLDTEPVRSKTPQAIPLRSIVPPSLIVPLASSAQAPPKPVEKVIPVPVPSVRLNGTNGNGDGKMVVRVDETVAFQPSVDDPKFKGQPRVYFNESRLKKLGESMRKHGQRQRVIVRPLVGVVGKKWEIIDGERRWRAAQIVGIEYLKAVMEEPESKQEQHLSSLILNFNKEGHTPWELSNALQEQVEAGMTIGDLADAIGKSRITVMNLLALQNIHSDLKPLLDPPTPEKERIPIMHGAYLSRIALDKQMEIWDEVKKQPTRTLMLEKIHELGKPHLIYKRARNRHTNPNQVSTRIKRRLERLRLTFKELEAFTPEEWSTYVNFKGVDEAILQLSQLTDAGKIVLELKQKLSRAKTGFINVTNGKNG